MLGAHAFLEYWKNRIEHDLASFADPGTPVSVSGSGRTYRGSWTMRGRDREATFSISRDQGVSVQVPGSLRLYRFRKTPYRSFMAGPEMGDLKQVAQMILQAVRRSLFVPTRAERSDITDGVPRPAIEVLTGLLDQADETSTRVIMITGEAGAGKTRVLEELVRHQANNYLHGRSSKLLFYVNAQGRTLARLNEALAIELQDLKVGLTYHSVAVLARLGILIPVIDGFDELLGVSGYDDAFSSLSGFLEQLEGEGQLLVSARSVYYEEEFLARAGSVSASGDQAWSHIPVRVREWEESDQNKFLDMWITEKELSDEESRLLKNRVRKTFSNENKDLASKPLFFTRVVQFLQSDSSFLGGEDLLGALVNEHLTRERNEKLLDRQSRPLLTESQLDHLMCELAQEMWNQETRELDSRSVREIAEYVVETEELEEYSESAKQAIVQRMPTLALLSKSDTSANDGGISFEHELFFFYFLARSMVSEFKCETRDVRATLSRSALPEDIADRVAMELRTSNSPLTRDWLQQILDRLSDASATEWRRTTQIRENAGLLAMALLREYAGSEQIPRPVEECTIRSVVFPGSHLRNVQLRKCTLVDMSIRRTDLASTQFEDCEARQTLLYAPLVALESTRLQLRGLAMDQVIGIRVKDGDSVKTSYVPSFIESILAGCGTPMEIHQPGTPQKVSSVYVDLLERLIRAYRRANPVCTEDYTLHQIFRHPQWGPLERLLLRHDILKKERRSTGGRPKEFLRRRFLPEQIMSGMIDTGDKDARIRSFWKELENISLEV